MSKTIHGIKSRVAISPMGNGTCARCKRRPTAINNVCVKCAEKLIQSRAKQDQVS